MFLFLKRLFGYFPIKDKAPPCYIRITIRCSSHAQLEDWTRAYFESCRTSVVWKVYGLYTMSETGDLKRVSNYSIDPQKVIDLYLDLEDLGNAVSAMELEDVLSFGSGHYVDEWLAFNLCDDKSIHKGVILKIRIKGKLIKRTKSYITGVPHLSQV